MRPVIKLLPRAEKDLLKLPAQIRNEILEKIELLEQFPQMGVVMEKAYQGYRCLLASGNQYRVIYKIKSPRLLEVAYIRHCRRQNLLRLI